MEWNENCHHGLKWQDQQHKQLFEKINELLESVLVGIEDKELFRKSIEFIAEYVKSHFKEEEYYMKKHGYARRDNHIEEHKRFIQDINLIVSEYKQNRPDSSVELLNTLTAFFFNHTQTTDKLLAKFLLKYENN